MSNWDDWEAKYSALAEAEVGGNGNGARLDLAGLYEEVPEGGGQFGGRDNALIHFVGAYRRRRFALEETLAAAHLWNRACCKPPLPDAEIDTKVRRCWVRWLEGNEPDLTPEEARGEPGAIEFLDFAAMLQAEQDAGAFKWLLDNVLPEGGLVYISAPPAGAKTWVLLDLIRAFVTGGNWFGKYPLAQQPVLYIDEEMGVRKVLPRLRKLGLTDGVDGLWYTDKAGVQFDRPQHVQAVLAHCEAHGVKVVVIDSFTRVHSRDENSNSEMRGLFKQFGVLMDRGIAVIVAHHDRKKGADESVKHERMRGAGDIAAMCDMAFSIDKVGRMFRLSTTKGRLVAEESQISVDFTVRDDEGGEHTALIEVSPEDKDRERGRELETRIRKALYDGAMNVNELVNATKARKADVSAQARAMADDGKLDTRKDGQKVYYALPGGFEDEDA